MPHPVAPSPESVGIDSAKLEDLFARAEREVREGRLPSVQIAAARHGRLAGMRTVGTVTHEGRPAPATDETLYVIFSCTKAITASAVWLLLEDGRLSLDTRAADVIPEFAGAGKEAITVEQLLTHTAGIPRAPYRQR